MSPYAALIRTALVGAACAATLGCAARSPRTATAPVVGSYSAYIANEASDLVTRVTFTPGGTVAVDRSIGIGEPGRILGPHGLVVAPDGKNWFVTLSHGVPSGRVAKYTTEGDSLVARVAVGAFPETAAMTPDGQYLFVSNSDIHAPGVVSGVSVIFAPTMTEVARPQTCVRPAGGRVDAAGTTYYSVCTTGDQLVAIDTRSFRVTHRFALAPGRERILDLDLRGGGRRVPAAACAPSWVEPGRGMHAGSVYVACSASADIVEVDVLLWQVKRRIDAGGAPHELATDAKGSVLLATLEADSALSVIDLTGTRQPTRVPLTQSSPHGIAITPDARYAFVTNEGGGRARGTVDVIDLARFVRVASTALAYSPGAIDLLPPGVLRR
jgi:DNA-binding beta-propeller fold protein YncE